MKEASGISNSQSSRFHPISVHAIARILPVDSDHYREGVRGERREERKKSEEKGKEKKMRKEREKKKKKSLSDVSRDVVM